VYSEIVKNHPKVENNPKTSENRSGVVARSGVSPVRLPVQFGIAAYIGIARVNLWLRVNLGCSV